MAPTSLYVNQGDGTFKSEGESRGAARSESTTMAAFADYDRDGDLDIYLVNNRLFTLGEESPDLEVRLENGQPTVHPDYRDQYFVLAGRIQEAGQRDVLLENNGEGVFSDVTTPAGIDGYDMGLAATWWDYNNDGWARHVCQQRLQNAGSPLPQTTGMERLPDVIADCIPHTPWFSMGADAADLNDDGILDFLASDMSSTTHYKQKTTMGEMGKSAWFLTMGNPRQFMRNALYLSTGIDNYMEAANMSGLDSTDWTWSVKFGDYDNDGLIDVFITNGYGRYDNDSDFQKEYKQLMAERENRRSGGVVHGAAAAERAQYSLQEQRAAQIRKPG